MTDGFMLLHANAHHMAVALEPLKTAVDRIAPRRLPHHRHPPPDPQGSLRAWRHLQLGRCAPPVWPPGETPPDRIAG